MCGLNVPPSSQVDIIRYCQCTSLRPGRHSKSNVVFNNIHVTSATCYTCAKCYKCNNFVIIYSSTVVLVPGLSDLSEEEESSI